jgi:hypothetical protein
VAGLFSLLVTSPRGGRGFDSGASGSSIQAMIERVPSQEILSQYTCNDKSKNLQCLCFVRFTAEENTFPVIATGPDH